MNGFFFLNPNPMGTRRTICFAIPIHNIIIHLMCSQLKMYEMVYLNGVCRDNCRRIWMRKWPEQSIQIISKPGSTFMRIWWERIRHTHVWIEIDSVWKSCTPPNRHRHRHRHHHQQQQTYFIVSNWFWFRNGFAIVSACSCKINCWIFGTA